MSMQIGASLGAYRIVEQLGRGGMATVYKAYQPRLDRYVAIKVILPLLAEEAGFADRFEREAIAVARLRHPNILTVHDYGDEGKVAYLVTELVEGGNLAAQSGKAHPLADVARWLGPVAAALDAAHRQGVVHRDVKPSNVLLRADGTPVLADFGIAALGDGSTRLTQTGMLMGTPAYMAPELASGQPATPASDQYALAIVAYELLTGRVPFDAETPMATALAHVIRPLPLPRSLNPSIGIGTERALLKGLAKRPEDRYPTVSAFVDELAGSAAVTGTPTLVDVDGTSGAQVASGIPLVQEPARNGTSQAAVSRPATGQDREVGAALAGSPVTVSVPGPAAARAPRARDWRWIALGGAVLVVAAIVVIGRTLLGGGTVATQQRAAAPPTAAAPTLLPVLAAAATVIAAPSTPLAPTATAIPVAAAVGPSAPAASATVRVVESAAIGPSPTAAPAPTSPATIGIAAGAKPTPGCSMADSAHRGEPGACNLQDSSTRPNDYQVGYEGDEYFIRKLSPDARIAFVPIESASADSYRDSTISVDARLVGDSDSRVILVGCRLGSSKAGADPSAPADTMYQLLVNPGAGSFSILRYVQNKLATLVPNSLSPAIKRGDATNHLEFGCVGTTLSVRINGTDAAKITDDGVFEGQAVIGVGKFGGGTAEARFAKLRVAQP